MPQGPLVSFRPLLRGGFGSSNPSSSSGTSGPPLPGYLAQDRLLGFQLLRRPVIGRGCDRGARRLSAPGAPQQRDSRWPRGRRRWPCQPGCRSLGAAYLLHPRCPQGRAHLARGLRDGPPSTGSLRRSARRLRPKRRFCGASWPVLPAAPRPRPWRLRRSARAGRRFCQLIFMKNKCFHICQGFCSGDWESAPLTWAPSAGQAP